MAIGKPGSSRTGRLMSGVAFVSRICAAVRLICSISGSSRLGKFLIPRSRHFRAKVFGIGLSRTGNFSLNAAFRILGYESIHFPIHLFTIDNQHLLIDVNRASPYDSMTAVWPFYKQLDQAFPGSKFVLTIRKTEPWLESCRSHFKYPPVTGDAQRDQILQRLRAQTYTTSTFASDSFLKAFHRHFSEVTEYFSDRSEDLLILELSGGHEWTSLCNFLALPVPNRAFPWKNRRTGAIDQSRCRPPVV